MKRILLVTRPISPPWDEASKNFAYFLARTLKKSELHVLTTVSAPALQKDIHQQPIYTSNHLNFLQKTKLLKLRKLSRDFDIFHFMLTPNKLNSFAFKNILRGKNIKTIQTVATLREDLFTDDEIKNSLFADTIITYSDYAKNKLEKLGLQNIKRIYPGIDLDLYCYEKKDADVMDKFKISSDDFVITYPGEYSRLGATDYIIETLPMLFEKIPNSKFIFACRVKNDADEKKKKNVIEQLKLNKIIDKVIFTDTFSDMSKLYNVSDVVVFPVKNMRGKFDVPLAVIEAFACEKPVIISDIPVLGEFTNENNSVIIRTGDSESLISSIVKLYQDKDLQKVLGKNARAYVEKDFNIKDVATQYEETYNKLLKL